MCIFKKKQNNFITLCVLNIPLFIAFFEDAKFVGFAMFCIEQMKKLDI